MLVDAHKGFNEITPLETMWMVRHFWTDEVRFEFNIYNHWVQLLQRQLRIPPANLIIQEG